MDMFLRKWVPAQVCAAIVIWGSPHGLLAAPQDMNRAGTNSVAQADPSVTASPELQGPEPAGVQDSKAQDETLIVRSNNAGVQERPWFDLGTEKTMIMIGADMTFRF
jgi:hypothetical protein